jgi:hypothetical protein
MFQQRLHNFEIKIKDVYSRGEKPEARNRLRRNDEVKNPAGAEPNLY